jgi:hypothetical protein
MDLADTGGFDFGTFVGSLITESSRQRTEKQAYNLELAKINAAHSVTSPTASGMSSMSSMLMVGGAVLAIGAILLALR